ncbi:MAG: 50S ribosomal protein L29 [Clostridia bacterium]|nr:50S ribosomal protein L29 [Clostridia bacterium]
MADAKKFKKADDKKLSYSELVTKRNELKKQYMDLRFQTVVSHVDNPMQKRIIRREIARLNTLIHQQDLEKFRSAAAEAIAANN